MVQFDYVSDLHIDHWHEEYSSLTPLGLTKNFPMKWKNIKSEILIIAGDVSDDLELTYQYIVGVIKPHYKKIFFIDGNHEHNLKMYSHAQIFRKFQDQEDIHYLPLDEVIIGDTVFLGYCGWWDFSQSKEINNYKNYERARLEFFLLRGKLIKYQKDSKIKEIVIVTHTVPLPRFVREKDYDYNSNFIEFTQKKYSKIKRWVFGHAHQFYDLNLHGIDYLSNPRGRPEDFNREKYQIATSLQKKFKN